MIQKEILRASGKFLVLALGIAGLVSACGDKKPDEDLQKAFQLHEEAIEVRQKAQQQMDELKANKDSMFLATHSEELQSITQALEEWDEQVVEVPGFEHEHDHGDHEGHDHSEHDHGDHEGHDHSEHDHGDHEDHSDHDHADHEDHSDHDHADHEDHSGHDHSGHDHHDHEAQPELTSKQHLEVQQFLLDEIKSIAERINTIKA